MFLIIVDALEFLYALRGCDLAASATTKLNKGLFRGFYWSMAHSKQVCPRNSCYDTHKSVSRSNYICCVSLLRGKEYKFANLVFQFPCESGLQASCGYFPLNW